MRTPVLLLARGSGAGAAAVLMLILVWLILPPAGQAGSTPDSGQALAPSAIRSPLPSSSPVTDTRWLALIRSTQPRRLTVQQTTALPSINLHLTDGFVAGRVSTAASVVISVTRAGSQVGYATTTPFPDGDGFFYLAYLYFYASGGGGGGYYGAQAGDVVWVTQANTAISMTVPALSAQAAVENDTVFGTAPISQPVTVYLFPFATPELMYTRTVTAGADGQYQAVWAPALDLRVRDDGYVAYAEAPERRAYVRFVTPFLRAQVNGPVVSGLAMPRSGVEITVTDTGGSPRFWLYAYAGADGFFQTYPGYGWPYVAGSLRPDDRIIAEAAGQIFSMTVMHVTAHADLANGRVWGEVPAGLPVEVIRFVGPVGASYYYDDLWLRPPDGQTTVTATSSGNYTASLPLARADYGAAVATSPDGHQTYARFAVPYLWIRMGESGLFYPTGYLAWGQVDDPGVPITIAIQGPSGYLKDVRHLTAGFNGYFYDGSYAGASLVLDSGDAITLTTPRGTQIALALPLLTAQADPLSDTVLGLAPAGARLTLTLFLYQQPPFPPPPTVASVDGGGYGYGQHTVILTATAQGEYQVDLGGIVDITNQTSGEVTFTTPEGHTVVRAFQAPPTLQHCQPRLGFVQIGGNLLSIQSDYDCPAVNMVLRLRDSQGRLKAEQPLSIFGWGSGYSLALFDGVRPILIVSGDTIEIEFADQPTPTPPLYPTPTPFPPSTPFPTSTPRPTQPAAPPALPAIAESVSVSQVITTQVPALSVFLDPAANVISGAGPAVAILSLDIYGEDFFKSLTTTVSAQGAYSVSLAGEHILAAGDWVRASYAPSGLPYFYTIGVLPMLQVTLHQPWLQGWLPPLAPFTASLASSYLITGYASYNGAFSASVYAASASLLPGDTVVVTTPLQVLQLTLPFLSARVDRATATVSGQAPPGARLQVDLIYPQGYGESVESQVVTATATGVYTATFPDEAPLSSARGTLTYFNPDGHQVRLEFAAPRWQVILDDPCVSGNAEVGGAPITVTLQAGNGTPKGVFTGTAWSTGGAFYACFQTTVQPEDRLTLIHAIGSTTYTVPLLTAEHDYARQALEGQAAPFRTIAATFQTGSYYNRQWVTRHTWADADGHYGLDTSDLSLPPGLSGYVVMSDEAGNTVQRNFTVKGYRAFLPLIVRSPESRL